MAPSHLGESAIEGWGFVVAAWAQLLLAVAVLLRPGRRVGLAVIATNTVLVAVWAVTRVAGLPFGAHAGHAESVSIVDGICVALEVGAIVLAAAMVRRSPAAADGSRSPLAVRGALGALGARHGRGGVALGA